MCNKVHAYHQWSNWLEFSNHRFVSWSTTTCVFFFYVFVSTTYHAIVQSYLRNTLFCTNCTPREYKHCIRACMYRDIVLNYVFIPLNKDWRQHRRGFMFAHQKKKFFFICWPASVRNDINHDLCYQSSQHYHDAKMIGRRQEHSFLPPTWSTIGVQFICIQSVLMHTKHVATENNAVLAGPKSINCCCILCGGGYFFVACLRNNTKRKFVIISLHHHY